MKSQTLYLSWFHFSFFRNFSHWCVSHNWLWARLAHYARLRRFWLQRRHTILNAKSKMWCVGKNGRFIDAMRWSSQARNAFVNQLKLLRRTLSKPERKNYIDAVRCIQTKRPTLYSDIKGAKSRFDDFQIVHIEQTFIIHYNASFSPLHRANPPTPPKIRHCSCRIVDRSN